MSPSSPAPSPELLQGLCDQFRNTRHDINNVFAVLLALAELGQINPANFERLGGAVLERCPKVLQDLQFFQDALFAALAQAKAQPSQPSQPLQPSQSAQPPQP